MNLNNSIKIVERSLSNSFLTNLIKIMLCVYIVLVPQKIAASLVNLIDNMIIRMLCVVLISLLATKDVSLALFFSLALIITLHGANSNRLSNLQDSLNAFGDNGWIEDIKTVLGLNKESKPKENTEEEIVEEPEEEIDEEPDEEIVEEPEEEIDEEPEEEIVEEPEEEIVEEPEEEIVEEPQEINNSSKDDAGLETEEYNNYVNKYRNLPGKIPLKSVPISINAPEGYDLNMNNNNAVFTNQVQFLDSQTNKVAGSNEQSCLGTFENSHCAGNLYSNIPNGF